MNRVLSAARDAAARLETPAAIRNACRPSNRLRAMFLIGIFSFAVLLLLISNAVRAGEYELLPAGAVINRNPKINSPAEKPDALGAAQGQDAEAVGLHPEIRRSFEEVDFALLTSQQPHQVGCNVPLEGSDSGMILFMGIFSSAKGRERRDLYRKYILPEFPPELVTVKFILGRPPTPTKGGSWKDLLNFNFEVEQAQYGDMVMLDIADNIDNGKTHAYFKWVADRYKGDAPVKGRPRFVMKTDDDTVLVMPNIISMFKELECSKNIYWGTSAGRSSYFGQYFRGLAYAMSWPLVSWIGNSDITPAHATGIEDARTGQWLRALDPVQDPVQHVDLGWEMGDWNQLDYTTETVALHWLKDSNWVTREHDRIKEIWHNASRPYDKDHGVAMADIIKAGREMPSAAREEMNRQQELGWDDTIVDEMAKED